jgi:streptogramin lyase
MHVSTTLRWGLASSVFTILGPAARPALAASPERGQTITEFPVPTAGSRPYTIVPGPDGALWFTESNGNKIGRITPSGQITEYPVPTAASGPYGIAVGADGTIWFTERFGDQIGRYSRATGQFAEFPVQPFSQPWEIAPGQDGTLWFTEEDADQVGTVSLQGSVTEFPTGACCFPTGIAPGVDANMWYTIEIGDIIGRLDPSGQTTPFTASQNGVLVWDITPGPDGNVWFSELAGRAIGRITPTGTVVEFPIPGAFSGIAGVTAGWDGNIWYTENDTDHVGAIDVSGNVLPTYNTGSRPLSITPGPDGNLWFTVADGNAIGRVNVASANVGYVLSMDSAFSPSRRGIRVGETVKWMFVGPRPHSVVDVSGLGLFDSGNKPIVSYFTHAFTAAGTFRYQDGIPPATKFGWITVPVTVPTTGAVGQPFLVTWGTAAQAANIVFDVQVEVPGVSGYTLWQSTAALSGNYTPATAGTYRFIARLRNTSTGVTIAYSPPASIVVQ